MKKRMAFLMLLFLAGLPLTAWAGHGHGQEEFPSFQESFFHKVEFLLGHQGDLGLTEDQIKVIKDKKFEIKRQIIQSEAQMSLAMLDIHKELHGDAPNMDQVNTLVDNKIEVKRTLAKALLQGLVDVKNVLTPEQRTKMKDMFWREYSRRGHYGSRAYCKRK